MNITPLLDDIDYLNDKTTDNDDYTKDIEDSNYDLKDLFASVNNFNDYLNDDDSVNENESVTKTGSQNDVLNDDSDSDGDTIILNLPHRQNKLEQQMQLDVH